VGQDRAGVAPLVAWCAFLVVVIAAFTALGSGALAAPPLTDPAAWADWAGRRDPFIAAAALLRVLVLALAWYLVGVTTIGIVARLTRAARLVRVADALTVPLVRRLLQGALGVGLATAVVANAGGPVPAPDLDHRAHAPIAGTVAAMDAVDVPTTVTMEPVADSAVVMESVDGAAVMEAVDDPAPDTAARHRIAAGEHLWGVAAATLDAHLGRAPDDAEVEAYWLRLVEANRDRLPDPANPDLVFPGMMVDLPDPDPNPRTGRS
jgi:hypothetical protein